MKNLFILITTLTLTTPITTYTTLFVKLIRSKLPLSSMIRPSCKNTRLSFLPTMTRPGEIVVGSHTEKDDESRLPEKQEEEQEKIPVLQAITAQQEKDPKNKERIIKLVASFRFKEKCQEETE